MKSARSTSALRVTACTTLRRRRDKGFMIMALLLMATALSSIMWASLSSWHAVIRHNRRAQTRLQQRVGQLRVKPAAPTHPGD